MDLVGGDGGVQCRADSWKHHAFEKATAGTHEVDPHQQDQEDANSDTQFFEKTAGFYGTAR